MKNPLLTKKKFNKNVIWGGTLEGSYPDLPSGQPDYELISYGTSEGVDAYKHVQFSFEIDGVEFCSWYQGLTDEDGKGQSQAITHKVGGVWQPYVDVFPPVSNQGSSEKRVVQGMYPIFVNNKWYHLAQITITNGSKPTYGNKTPHATIGLIAREHISPTTFGSIFCVHSYNGATISGLSGFPNYAYNEPLSSQIREAMRSADYETYFYDTDTDTPDMGGKIAVVGGLDYTYEISSVNINGTNIRASRNFTNLTLTETQRVYLDFKDGLPAFKSSIPACPVRPHIFKLRDNRVVICTGPAGTINTGNNYRKFTFIAISDPNTLKFRNSNIYKIFYGEDTGAVFSGLYKYGVWAYMEGFHSPIDNLIHLTATKYKESVWACKFPVPSHNWD